jgi:NAD(P)-dependent dehydrogenase (short-subunit alcohol dehydrogenase family)
MPKDKGTALIVGGSGGLGRAVAELLAMDREGICLTYQSNVKMAGEVCDEISGLCAATSVRMDIRSDEDIASAYERANVMPGKLRCVVIASGEKILQPYISRITYETWADVIELELLGFTRLIGHILPYLRENRGTTVSIVSFANRYYPPVMLNFCPTCR